MSNIEVHNVNVAAQDVLITPQALKEALPLSDAATRTVAETRQVIENILDRKDHRIFVVVGPCSMFSPFFSLLFTPLAAVSKKEGRRARATIKRKQLLKRGSGMRDMRVFVVGPSVFTLKRGRGQFGLLHF